MLLATDLDVAYSSSSSSFFLLFAVVYLSIYLFSFSLSRSLALKLSTLTYSPLHPISDRVWRIFFFPTAPHTINASSALFSLNHAPSPKAKVIDRVKSDIGKLHEKFKVQYPYTLNAKMSEIRDLPPISGHIIWARSLERQLSSFLGRVESVLGRGWENHVEGRALKDDGDNFRALLNTKV